MNEVDDFCHKVTLTAQFLEKKHTILILAILAKDGSKCFMELIRDIQTDKKTLSARLKQLTDAQLVLRTESYVGKVKKTHYQLTDKGMTFNRLMSALYEFSTNINFNHD